jgi:hypothetical protein
MYPNVSETAAFVQVTKAQAAKNRADHECLMRELVQLAKEMGAKRLHIYNFDGRDLKFESYNWFVVRDSDGTLYPQFDKSVRDKLSHIETAKQAGTLVMLDISYCVQGLSKAVGESVPLTPKIVVLVDDNNMIVRFATGILACKYTGGNRQYSDWEQKHPSLNYEYLIGATIFYAKPKIGRTGRLLIVEAYLLPRLEGEAARRQQFEKDAAQKLLKKKGLPCTATTLPFQIGTARRQSSTKQWPETQRRGERVTWWQCTAPRRTVARAACSRQPWQQYRSTP